MSDSEETVEWISHEAHLILDAHTLSYSAPANYRIVSISHSFSPENPIIDEETQERQFLVNSSFSSSSASFTVYSEHDFTFLFGMTVQYLKDEELVDITNWDDLPESAEEIIKYRVTEVGVKTYTFTTRVVCESTSATEEEPTIILGGDYIIEIYYDYDIGAAKLCDEVNKRRV